MRALVWHGALDLRIEARPEPDPPGSGQALVEVAYCGICGTDLHEYRSGPVMIRSGPHPLTGASPPMTLGHEFSGRVVALGSETPGVSVGDRVTVDPCWSCGECFWCRRGDYHICRVGGAVGTASHGALAPLVIVPASGLVRLPDAVDDQTGAIVEPLAVGVHAVRRSGLRQGDSVVISGFGPIGAAVLVAARAAGASKIIVLEPLEGRRQRALALGATEALDPLAVDARREVFVRNGRIGPDVVFDCSGVPALLQAAVGMARRGGTIVACGVNHGHAELEVNGIVLYERTVIGSLGYNHDLLRVVDMLAAGRLTIDGFVTAVVPLEDAVEGAFEMLANDRGAHLKVLIEVGG